MNKKKKDNTKTPEEIRKSYPSYDDTKPPKMSASQMAGDPEEMKRPGSTPAQGDNQTMDDEVSDDGKIDLMPTESDMNDTRS